MESVTLQTPAGPVEALLPRQTCRLASGAVGYFQRRQDDCAHAALATVLQVPYEDVPDFNAEHRGQTFADELARTVAEWEWCSALGLRTRYASRPPNGIETFCAVGVPDEDRWRHVCAVVEGQLFDPGSGFILPPGFEDDGPIVVDYIYYFEREESP